MVSCFMKSAEEEIREYLDKVPEGTILFPEDFELEGTYNALKIGLHRLVKIKYIVRMGHGIYAKPKQSKLLGQILPTTDEVAKAIAKRDRARILPTGSYASYLLGLSTQLPLKIVYLTDGSARKVKVGKSIIVFKKVAPKQLAMEGEISKLVVQALKEIGKDNITEKEEKIIMDQLKKEDTKKLRNDIALAPQWIGEIMAKAL